MRAVLVALVIAGCADIHDDRLGEAFDAAAKVPHVTSVSVRRDGAVVREAFLGGTDRATLHDVRSVTKTVTSLLIGSALQAGCLTSVDQTLGEVLGERAPSDPAKAAITLRDVLMMSSGFAWSESGAIGDYNPWAGAEDQVAFVLARPLVATPGTVFNYNSGAMHLLSVAIDRACGPTLDFAAGGLFAGLGIASRTWETDNQGVVNGASGLQLTTADLGQIGELILGRGELAGARLVSADYIADATSGQILSGSSGTPWYGYGIWNSVEPVFSMAQGYGGQFVLVVPDRRAVVVVTTEWSGLGTAATTDFNRLFNVLIDDMIPAL